MGFNVGFYNKPKLTETKIVKKIIDTQVIEIPTEQKIFNNIMTFLCDNYHSVIITLLILSGLYWRYNDTKKKKILKNQIENFQNYDSYDFI